MKTLIINGTNLVAQGTDNSRFIYRFPAGAVNFQKDEVAVASLNIYYSWRNISAAQGNNTFSYVWYSGAGPTVTTVNITIPDGSYDISQLNAYLQSIMITNNHYLITASGSYVYFLELVENPTAYAIQFNSYALLTAAQAGALGYTTPTGWPGYVTTNITPQIIISATNFRNIIGFNAGTYPSPTQTTNYSKVSDFTPQVSPTQSVLISCSLVNNPYALPANIIYSFSPVGTSYGSLIQPQISNFIWNSIQDGYYNSFTIQFLDQNYNSLLLQDTNLVLVLSIRHREESS